MRILICPDKFKGSATANEVAEAIARGIADARPGKHTVHTTVNTIPLADGGDGTLAVLSARPGATVFSQVVSGPLGTLVDACWALLADGTAVVEMAQASGLALVDGPLRAREATTFGTGQLMMCAIAQGATRCIVGVGGSATTDGGLGALDALGWSLHGMEVVVATDVTTTFVDAARVFGPQKGATPADVDFLVDRLEQLADRYERECSVDVRMIERGGAAGGLAGGLYVLGARLVSGFDLIAEVVGLDQMLDRVDLVITGEGRADATSFVGKPVGGVLGRAAERGLPVIVVCGVADLDEQSTARFASVHQVLDLAPNTVAAIADPLPFLEVIGRQIGEHL